MPRPLDRYAASLALHWAGVSAAGSARTGVGRAGAAVVMPARKTNWGAARLPRRRPGGPIGEHVVGYVACLACVRAPVHRVGGTL